MPVDPMLLLPYAAKYCWWKRPQEAVLFPALVIAQVMNIGTFADIAALLAAVGEAAFRDVLLHAEPGQFTPRAWAYWHYRFGLAEVDQVPALPQRKFG